jgi:hypothetical protein
MMDYIKNIGSWQEFLTEASNDPDGTMEENVRSCLGLAGPENLGENIIKIRAAAWKKYKKYNTAQD